jgi:glycosyltransferase involved in cell wall biosynthesis
MNASVDALSQRLGDDLLYLVYGSHSGAPYASELPDHRPSFVLNRSSEPVAKYLEDFKPDVLLVSGWDAPDFMEAVRAWQKRAVCLLFMDNQWLRKPKQILGIATRHFFVRKLFQGALVPGERQVQFARLLGFESSRILQGGYSCDVAAFTPPPGASATRQNTFLVCNRLVESKGVSDLLAAYSQYRSKATDPWDLVVCGTGPLAASFSGVPGVQMRGFVQPADLPAEFHRAGALVLASHFEPWGVVVHEAAVAGMPVICTDAVGAGVHLVADGASGYVVPTRNVDLLAGAMAKLSGLTIDRRVQMGAVSTGLGEAFSNERWATNVLELCARVGA